MALQVGQENNGTAVAIFAGERALQRCVIPDTQSLQCPWPLEDYSGIGFSNNARGEIPQ